MASDIQVELWTDGSGTASGPGGWAWVLRAIDKATGEIVKQTDGCGCSASTTNNRMELTAVLMGLRALKHPTKLTVFTDSEYVAKPFSEGWLKGWQERNWRTNAGRGPEEGIPTLSCPTCAAHAPDEGVPVVCDRHMPYADMVTRTDRKQVANRDLWLALVEVTYSHTIRFMHVKGHAKGAYPLNEHCDLLAGQGRRFVIDGIASGQFTAEDIPQVEGATSILF